MISALRVFNRLEEAGLSPIEPRNLISGAASTSWRKFIEGLDVWHHSLQTEEAVLAGKVVWKGNRPVLRGSAG